LASREGYQCHLKKLLGWYTPMEAALADNMRQFSQQWQALGFEAQGRWKVPWLEADLRALSNSREGGAHASATGMDFLTTVGCALGAWYVVEGATHGNLRMQQQCLEVLGFASAAEDGLCFFTGYGPQHGRQWQAFVDLLQRFEAASPSACPEVITGANLTFESFAAWFRQK
jgi:heme oxygenase